MPRINLLPWREEQRKARMRNFVAAAAGAVLVGAGLVFAGNVHYNGLVDHQEERNAFLKKEIALLDAQITEIKELEDQKKRLLDRMAIIETLQRGRPEVVHLFDELVRTLPDGVHLNSVKQAGKRVTLTGIAESSTRVSAYMRNDDNSEWLADPGLNDVETVQRDRSRKSEFTIFAKQVSPLASNDEEDAR